MHVAPGIRIRYENGLTLFAAVPINLSREVGYDAGHLTPEEETACDSIWTDGYSPFYADWKIAGKISFPIRFKITNYEVIRKFLLMKERGEKQVIDIDEDIKKSRSRKKRKRKLKRIRKTKRRQKTKKRIKKKNKKNYLNTICQR